MKAEEFIRERYPKTVKEIEDGNCVGLNDIAYICEQYHKYKTQNVCLGKVIDYVKETCTSCNCENHKTE